ncbi:MAG: UDP-3-O-acyl-N-acetylglucosamine deacetylase [Armatimonadetes bacterium]|nr:UDP-3-O-acyl-N-acetylglucosamine deacetylase [Armatimonadota bacterium]
MNFRRKTLTHPAVFEGLGLHSGEPVTVEIKAGEHGLAFTHNGERFESIPENVTDTARCTKLGTISTIEHLMSAFAAHGVTDAEVMVSGGELPALDGASKAYFDGISAAGLTVLGERSVAGPSETIVHEEDDVRVEVSSGSGVWRFEFECGDRWPHSQHFEISLGARAYAEEVAPARTFAFEDEMEMVREAGLGQGLDETTAFLIGSYGYVNETKFEDEPVRHKMLDLIGDLYLSGVPVELLNVVALRSGHTANVAVAQKLRDAVVFSD